MKKLRFLSSSSSQTLRQKWRAVLQAKTFDNEAYDIVLSSLHQEGMQAILSKKKFSDTPKVFLWATLAHMMPKIADLPVSEEKFVLKAHKLFNLIAPNAAQTTRLINAMMCGNKALANQPKGAALFNRLIAHRFNNPAFNKPELLAQKIQSFLQENHEFWQHNESRILRKNIKLYLQQTSP